MKNAVVIACDGLSSRYLGPYGNHTVPTPTWNRLAAESSLWDFALIDNPQLTSLYQAYLRGTSWAACDDDPLPEQLSRRGVTTVLIADDATIGDVGQANGFDEVICLAHDSEFSSVADVADSRFSQLLATAVDWLEHASEPFLLWVHSQGMLGPWDAPYELRCYFADEEDPDPPEQVEPPGFQQHSPIDEDVLLGWRQAYSAQVMMWDMCLDTFWEHFQANALATRTALCLTASRGYPLGEHGRVGIADRPLFGELLNVPLLLRLPDQVGAMQRHRQLVQPADVFQTMLDWFEQPPAEAPISELCGVVGRSLLPLLAAPDAPWRDRAACVAPGQQLLRTSSWQLRKEIENSSFQLFAKPEDVWELNDVADRCSEEVTQLDELLSDFVDAAQNDPSRPLSPMPDDLEA